MSGAVPLINKSFRKAWALVAVYVLHLVFFQVLMQASPSHNIDNTFKPLFANHSQNRNAHNPKPSHHPAVTYYSMLLKQGNDFGGVCSHINPVINQMEVVLPPSSSISAVAFHVYEAGLNKLHLADDAFKLYRLIHVFLI